MGRYEWSLVTDNRVRLDLDEHVTLDEPRHLDHARGRTDRPENFAVCLAHVLPIANIGHVDARANDILEVCASLFERTLDILKRLDRLGIRIAPPNDAARFVSRRRS